MPKSSSGTAAKPVKGRLALLELTCFLNHFGLGLVRHFGRAGLERGSRRDRGRGHNGRGWGDRRVERRRSAAASSASASAGAGAAAALSATAVLLDTGIRLSQRERDAAGRHQHTSGEQGGDNESGPHREPPCGHVIGAVAQGRSDDPVMVDLRSDHARTAVIVQQRSAVLHFHAYQGSRTVRNFLPTHGDARSKRRLRSNRYRRGSRSVWHPVGRGPLGVKDDVAVREGRSQSGFGLRARPRCGLEEPNPCHNKHWHRPRTTAIAANPRPTSSRGFGLLVPAMRRSRWGRRSSSCTSASTPAATSPASPGWSRPRSRCSSSPGSRPSIDRSERSAADS